MSFLWTRKVSYRNIKTIQYDEYWMERGFHVRNKLREREIIIFERIYEGTSVLDIGCGNSLLPVKLKEQKKCDVSVGDISPIVLEGYREKGINAVMVDLEMISTFCIDRKYDYIILSEVLEHLKNPEEVIHMLKNYTKNFLITIPNSGFYRYRFYLMFKGRFWTQWVIHPSEHLRFWTHRDFINWLRDMDLDVNASISSNGVRYFNIKSWWKNLFAHQIVYDCKKKIL